MGTAKAAIRFGQDTLAQRTARLLAEVADPALEVGPGYTELGRVVEQPPGLGPLAAMAAGGAELRRRGHPGPCLVVATDLPRLNASLLAALAEWPGEACVVPVAGGRRQILCARYSAAALQLAEELVAGGCRAVGDLLVQVSVVELSPAEWQPAAGHPDALADADTPADLARLGLGGRG